MIKSKIPFSSKFFVSLIMGFSMVAIFAVPLFYVSASVPCISTTGEIVQPLGDGSCPSGSAPVDANNNPSQLSARASADKGIAGLISQLVIILNYVVPFLISLAVFLIIYGIFGYISKADDEEKRKEARDFIIWGVIGVFCMLSVWGLVNILVKTFNLDQSAQIVIDTYGVARDAYGNVVSNPSSSLSTQPTTVVELITRINIIGSYVVPFLISIAVFIIILGTVNYVRQGDNEEKRAEARMFILWGVVSIFLMLSIWGLVNILVKSFNFNNQVPSLQNIFENLKV